MLGALGRRIFTGMGVIAVLLIGLFWPQLSWAQLTDTPTNVTCDAGQSLWIYELGTRGNAAAPSAQAEIQSASSLDIWTLSDQSVTTGRLSGFPADIVSGRLYERFTPKPDSPPIQIGDFAVDWPSGVMAGATQAGSVTPIAAPNAIGNVSPIDISSVYEGEGSGNLLDFLKSEARESGLTYFINSGAQFEYLRLALCSDVPPSPIGEVESIEDVPTPRLKPPVETQFAPSEGGGTQASTSVTLEGGPASAGASSENNGVKTTPFIKGPDDGPDSVDPEGLSMGLIAALALVGGLAALGLAYGLKSGSIFSKALRPSKPSSVTPNQNSAMSNASSNAAPIDPSKLAQAAGVAAAAALVSKTVTLGSNTVRAPRRPRGPERPEKTDVMQTGLETGLLFEGSPMVATGMAPLGSAGAQLASAGQMSAANLQALTGAYEGLRPAYQATGRVGYSQEGAPTRGDFSLGTGFLITPSHIMTARHVHESFGRLYLTGEDCGGIEFLAEKDNDQSEFYEFNGEPAQVWEGLDICVYTLARPVTDRVPLPRREQSTQDLDGRDIVIFGYPDTMEPDDDALSDKVEPDPIFAVKRVSQGKIFRHSTDDDAPYGVTAYINMNEQLQFEMPAICHNASTLGGNSGSPVLDAKTGALLGVHFAGKPDFSGAEDANLAMAIEQIIKEEARQKTSKFNSA